MALDISLLISKRHRAAVEVRYEGYLSFVCAQRALAPLRTKIFFMKHHPHFSHRQRPPWWPENEDWPPKRWQYMRGKPFFRRMGCFFFGFSFLAFVGLLGILRLVLAPFIDFHGSPPLARPDFIFPLGLAGFFILLAVIFWGARTL